MPDDISIPQHDLSRHDMTQHDLGRTDRVQQSELGQRTSFTHSYRARRTGMDAGTRRLFMAASALGLVLVVGMAVYSFTGHRAAGIPVIEADTRPLRAKPENPGGMSVIGANEALTTDDERSDMAPAAERPDPQALRAQRPAAAAPAAPTAAAPAATAPLPSTAGNAQATPAPVAVAPSAAAPAAPSPARVATGGTVVQIASLENEAGATAEWQRLAKKMPELLGNRRPVIQRAEANGKTVWRLRTGGFADIADATQFCQKVRAKGAGCSIADF